MIDKPRSLALATVKRGRANKEATVSNLVKLLGEKAKNLQGAKDEDQRQLSRLLMAAACCIEKLEDETVTLQRVLKKKELLGYETASAAILLDMAEDGRMFQRPVSLEDVKEG